MRTLFAFCLLLITLAAPFAQAAPDLKDITYTIEPIIGYEYQKKTDPIRSKLVLTYGARIIAGYKVISGEGEYTTGQSDEVFPEIFTQIIEKTEKARLGLRTSYAIGSMLDSYLRAGGEAQKKHTIKTIVLTVTETDSPYKVYPYIGTGLTLKLGSHFGLNANVLATLKDINDLTQTEYSTSVGVSIH